MTCWVMNHPPMPSRTTVARIQKRMMGSVQDRRLAAGVTGRGGGAGAGGAEAAAAVMGADPPA